MDVSFVFTALCQGWKWQFLDKVIQFRILCLGCPWKTSLFLVRIWSTDQACKILWHRHHKDLGGCNFAIISYFFDVSYQDDMVGILSFLQDITLEGSDNAYNGTKYAVWNMG